MHDEVIKIILNGFKKTIAKRYSLAMPLDFFMWFIRLPVHCFPSDKDYADYVMESMSRHLFHDPMYGYQGESPIGPLPKLYTTKESLSFLNEVFVSIKTDSHIIANTETEVQKDILLAAQYLISVIENVGHVSKTNEESSNDVNVASLIEDFYTKLSIELFSEKEKTISNCNTLTKSTDWTQNTACVSLFVFVIKYLCPDSGLKAPSKNFHEWIDQTISELTAHKVYTEFEEYKKYISFSGSFLVSSIMRISRIEFMSLWRAFIHPSTIIRLIEKPDILKQRNGLELRHLFSQFDINNNVSTDIIQSNSLVPKLKRDEPLLPESYFWENSKEPDESPDLIWILSSNYKSISSVLKYYAYRSNKLLYAVNPPLIEPRLYEKLDQLNDCQLENLYKLSVRYILNRKDNCLYNELKFINAPSYAKMIKFQQSSYKNSASFNYFFRCFAHELTILYFDESSLTARWKDTSKLKRLLKSVYEFSNSNLINNIYTADEEDSGKIDKIIDNDNYAEYYRYQNANKYVRHALYDCFNFIIVIISFIATNLPLKKIHDLGVIIVSFAPVCDANGQYQQTDPIALSPPPRSAISTQQEIKRIQRQICTTKSESEVSSSTC